MLFVVRLQLQETGSVFEPSVGGGLFDLVKSIITDIYTAANQLARISVSRHGNYQETLQQCQDLRALEQEVMRHMQQVRDEAESLREGLDRYAHLWESDRQGVMHEFLKYGRQVRPEEPDAEETPPTLKDVQREVRHTCEVRTHLCSCEVRLMVSVMFSFRSSRSTD